MEFVIKKTTELTTIEKQSLLDCFNEVFEKERTMEEMLNQYLNTPMGYCIHSLCIDECKVVGAFTAFPSYYYIGDKKYKFYFTGDSMVMKGYRDGSVYLDITMNMTSYMKKDNYVLAFGFPNENAYVVNKKGRQAVDFGRLDTYVLPYRIGGIKSCLGWLNPLSKLFCRLWLICSGACAKKEVVKPLIHKDDESYNLTRYQRMDGDYQRVKLDNNEFYYKIKTHEGVRTAFIVDLINKSEQKFRQAVKYIMKTEKKNFDLLMYVGHLPVTINKIGLIKIPRKHEPKHFYMTGKILDKSLDSNIVYNIDNWDVNLSDYDLI